MGIVLKIVLIIGILIIVVGITGITRMRMTLARNGKARKPKELIYDGRSGKNALVLYQPSPHGTVDVMAKAAAEALQDMGYTVTLNYPSEELDYDLNSYQVLAFGSAVYMGSVSGALVHYIKNCTFAGKKVFLFSVGKNLREKSELAFMEKFIGEGNMVSKLKVSKGEEKLVEKIIRQQFL